MVLVCGCFQGKGLRVRWVRGTGTSRYRGLPFAVMWPGPAVNPLAAREPHVFPQMQFFGVVWKLFLAGQWTRRTSQPGGPAPPRRLSCSQAESQEGGSALWVPAPCLDEASWPSHAPGCTWAISDAVGSFLPVQLGGS